MIVLAIIAGIATWLLLSFLWAFAVGLMRAATGGWGALAGMQPWKTAIMVPGWFGATWAGWTVFAIVA